MNKPTFLSDTSTSESEDDFSKSKHLKQKFSETRVGGVKRKHEDDDDFENNDILSKKLLEQLESNNQPSYSVHRLSADDTEDENLDTNEFNDEMHKNLKSQSSYELGCSADETDEHLENAEFSDKFINKPQFRPPSKYVEREFTDSEKEDKISKNIKNAPSMPTAENFNGQYGSAAMKIMAKMGYIPGVGLGKDSQGRTDIVEASKQRGRRGLGLHLESFEPSDVQWDSSEEMISLKEDINWIPECILEPLTIQEMRAWLKEGPKKETINDETEFCDPQILKNVLAFKSVFDQLEPEEMRKARTRSNPFETIRGAIFLNRAAMKMANMDYAFDFMFTKPLTENGEEVIGPKELLYFADICAGPGGFSEYVLWRKKWHCKGFGFTLKEKNDFKLDDFFAGSPETFEPFYGVNEDGNIYVPENLRSFAKFVFANTDNKGVHFVMADGGFSVEGEENLQEILSKRLYLCQFLCALMILRLGGHFVCKLFDIFTPFSVGLIYLMYNAFEKVCIFKPNTSRPANSERYIICKWRKENIKDIADYMFEVNCNLAKYHGVVSDTDIIEVVPLKILKENEAFYNYILNSNNILGQRQIVHLNKIRAFTQNANLHEPRQSDLRKNCLELWKIPDKLRSAPTRPNPEDIYRKLIKKNENTNYLSYKPEMLTPETLKKLDSIFEYHCLVCGVTTDEQPPSFFLGLGRSHIYRYDIRNAKWQKIDATLELPTETLFYGELIPELRGEGRAQRKLMCLHVIDAIVLGGQDVRNENFVERMLLAEKLSKAVSKPSKPDYTLLRVKKVWELQQISELLESLSLKSIKSRQIPKLCFDLGDGRHIIPSGLMIFRTILKPWVIAYSKSNKRIYFFNTKKNISSFERVEEANASFKECFLNRMLWKWESDTQLIPEQHVNNNLSVVHGHTLVNFVMHHLRRITGQAF